MFVEIVRLFIVFLATAAGFALGQRRAADGRQRRRSSAPTLGACVGYVAGGVARPPAAPWPWALVEERVDELPAGQPARRRGRRRGPRPGSSALVGRAARRPAARPLGLAGVRPPRVDRRLRRLRHRHAQGRGAARPRRPVHPSAGAGHAVRRRRRRRRPRRHQRRHRRPPAGGRPGRLPRRRRCSCPASCSTSCRASPTPRTRRAAAGAGAASSCSTPSRSCPASEVHVLDDEVVEHEEVDAKLVALARRLEVAPADRRRQPAAGGRAPGRALPQPRTAWPTACGPCSCPARSCACPITREGKEPGQGVGLPRRRHDGRRGRRRRRSWARRSTYASPGTCRPRWAACSSLPSPSDLGDRRRRRQRHAVRRAQAVRAARRAPGPRLGARAAPGGRRRRRARRARRPAGDAERPDGRRGRAGRRDPVGLGAGRPGRRARRRPTVVLVHDAARPLAPAGRLRGGGRRASSRRRRRRPRRAASPTRCAHVDGRRTVDRDRARRRADAAGVPGRGRCGPPTPASRDATDDATLVEAAGGRVVVVPGEPANLKITTPDDLRRARGAAR